MCAVVVTEIPCAGAEVAADRAASPSCSTRRSCRCSPTCATKSPRTSASCSSRARARSSPRSLMEILFKLTELESRIPLNMNVLVQGQVPEGDGPRRGAARIARSSPRRAGAPLGAPAGHRSTSGSKCSAGLLIVYLNLDEVIRIIRNEDEPKPELMQPLQAHRGAGRRHPQHAAALVAQARGDGDPRERTPSCARRRRDSRQLLAPRQSNGRRSPGEIKEVAQAFGPRPRSASAAPTFAERRARRGGDRGGDGRARAGDRRRLREGLDPRAEGHVADLSGVAFKGTTRSKIAFFAETTSKMLVFATDGRVFTLDAAKLPGGRGHGEPIRLLIDLEQDDDVVAVFPCHSRREAPRRQPRRARLRRGRGRMRRQHAQGQADPQRRRAGDEAAPLREVDGDHVAVIGENRKMLVFPLEQLPEMTRGKGVRLQRYKDGGALRRQGLQGGTA